MVRLLAVFFISAFCADAENFGDWEYRVENSKVIITRYNGIDSLVTSPNEIEGLPVTKIDGYVFADRTNVVDVTISAGVLSIGQNAFYNCFSLTNVTIPIGVKSIGNNIFYGCGALRTINLPEGLESIGEGAFRYCGNLNSITIPESVTSVGYAAFTGCVGLSLVSIPERFWINRAFMEMPSSPINVPQIISLLANSLSTNQVFISNLAQAILSTSNNYGLATQSGVSNTITATTSNLVTQSEILTLATKTELTNALAQSRTDGINSVISNPNLWTLYTTNQIHAMAIGNLVLTSTNNGQFVLNYDIEQSEDLVNWTPYQGFAMPLTNLPTNKAFVRIKAKQ